MGCDLFKPLIPLDLIARRVIMSSVLYYCFDTHMMNDGEYDKSVRLLVDKWSQLDPIRQWQLSTDIATSGMFVKITQASLYGALNWANMSEITPIVSWKWEPKFRVHWATIGDIDRG